jgi:hypothetical protein
MKRFCVHMGAHYPTIEGDGFASFLWCGAKSLPFLFPAKTWIVNHSNNNYGGK